MNAPADLQIPTSLALDALRESPTNPRKHFDPQALDELAASLREHGVMSPLLVRPAVGEARAYEIVAGARRYRAAKLAQLQTVPALIRDLTDKQVVELQLIENLQRKDLHELEEAEGFKLLVDRHGYSVDDIAAKIGKSVRHVYTRLQLCRIRGEAREKFSAGKLSASVALLIARIPVHALQQQAAAMVSNADHRGEPMSFRQARDFIEREYMLDLKSAPFQIADSSLVPKAGACNVCPKRTGNQPELFGDVKSGDTCTDPPCFAAKREAAKERVFAEAKAKGLKVITGKQAREIKPHEWSASLSGGYVDLDERCYDDPSGKARTWRELLKGSTEGLHGLALLEAPKSGDLLEIAPKSVLRKAAELRGVDWKSKTAPTGSSRGTSAADAKIEAKISKQRAEIEAKEKLRARVVQAILPKVPATPAYKDLRLLAVDLLVSFDHVATAPEELYDRWQLQVKSQVNDAPAVLTAVKDAELLRFMLDLVLTQRVDEGLSQDGKADLLMETAARYRVDPAKIKAAIAAEEKEAADKAKAEAAVKGAAKTPAKKVPAKKAAAAKGAKE
jgi:ParB/RepB/Spo0J family partition protein